MLGPSSQSGGFLTACAAPLLGPSAFALREMELTIRDVSCPLSVAMPQYLNDVTFSAPKTHAERLLVSQAMGSTVCDASADQVGEARHG